jgi:hypothetical protein
VAWTRIGSWTRVIQVASTVAHDGVLRVDLHGEAAAILQLSAAGKKGRLQLGEGGEQLVMVAGARNQSSVLPPLPPFARISPLKASRSTAT